MLTPLLQAGYKTVSPALMMGTCWKSALHTGIKEQEGHAGICGRDWVNGNGSKQGASVLLGNLAPSGEGMDAPRSVCLLYMFL